MEQGPLYIISSDNIRHRYVFDFIFNQVLGLNYQIVNTEFPFPADARIITHGKIPFDGALNVPDSGLLDESFVITKQVKRNGVGKNLKLFISDHRLGYELDYDLFSMVFYCLSRYEEYGAVEFDRHGRYIHTQSMLFDPAEEFIHPVLDYRIRELADLIADKWNMKIAYPPFNAEITVDIDVAWFAKCKGIYRTLGALLRELFKGHLGKLRQRLKILLGNTDDPFDTYERVGGLAQKYKLPLHYFFLLSKTRSRYDRNSERSCRHFKRLIKKLAGEATIGLHYSYASFDDFRALQDEKYFLSRLVTVDSGRAHFLRSRFPFTFCRLEETGIKHDYSLGYAEIPGFRAGTAHSFPFFDLEKNKASSLILHPVTLMDGTLVDYRRSSPAEAEKLFNRMVDSMQSGGGTFYLLIHNETFSRTGRWNDWDGFFERIIVTLGAKSVF